MFVVRLSYFVKEKTIYEILTTNDAIGYRESKMIKTNELRNMTADEIRLKIEALKKELFNLRTEAKAGRIEKPHRINEIRKDIARCETVIREKENKPEKANAK